MFSPLTFLSVGTEEYLADQGLEVELESKYPEFKKGKTERIEIDATVDALNAVTRFVSALAKKTG